MAFFSRFKMTILLTVTGMLFLFVAFFLSGGGHSKGGSYAPLIAIFPWGMSPLIWSGNVTGFFQCLIFTQFTLYGLLIDLNTNHRQRLIRLIVITHIILAVFILLLRNVNWR
jgi:hypothetical protein